MTKWGLVATVKADTRKILEFAAHHLELGAHRLYIYLDDPDPETYGRLKAHPKIRVTACDEAYWRKRPSRPVKHQVRQSFNATHAYHRKTEVDWLAHIDVDEFLWPAETMAEMLAKCPSSQTVARVRPAEALGESHCFYKAFIPPNADREAKVARLYPQFGTYVKGGFLSHVIGKIFVRTGLENVEIRIHRAFFDGVSDDGTDLENVDLLHLHSGGWDHWLTTYRYRIDKGSYRAELKPAQPRETGGASLHQLFTMLEAEEGPAGLRRFFDEVCANTPDLQNRLKALDLLLYRPLDLATSLAQHFPEWKRSQV